MNEDETTAIEALYLEIFQPLFVYARAALPSDNAALEIVQETFRIASARPAALFSAPDPKGWLLVTLKYVIQNEKRSRAALSRLLLADYSYTAGTVSEPGHPVVSASELLNEEDYTLLSGFAFEGRPLKVAAELLQSTVADCQNRFCRARLRLLTRTDPEKVLRDR